MSLSTANHALLISEKSPIVTFAWTSFQIIKENAANNFTKNELE